MGTLLLEGVPDDELRALESRGRRHGRSLEAEVLTLIHEAAREERVFNDLSRAEHEIERRLSQSEPATAPPRPRSRHYRPTRGRRGP